MLLFIAATSSFKVNPLKSFLLILVLFIVSFFAQASQSDSIEVEIKLFGAKYGLTDVSVNVVETGCNGELWVGTEDGLYLFNGYEFQKIGMKDTQRILNVQCINFDSTLNSVYVGSNYGLYKLQRTSYTLIPVNDHNKHLDKPVTAIHLRDGKLFFATQQNQLYEYDILKQTSKFLWENKGVNVSIRAFVPYNNHLYFVPRFSQTKVWKLDMSLMTVNEIPFTDSIQSKKLIVDGDNKMWLHTKGGLYKFHNGSFEWHFDMKESESDIYHDYNVHCDIQGRVWGFRHELNGIFLIDPTKREMTLIEVLKSRDKLNGVIIEDVISDDLGVFWCSTNKGLLGIRPQKKLFKNWLSDRGYSTRAILVQNDIINVTGYNKSYQIFSDGSIKEQKWYNDFIYSLFRRDNESIFCNYHHGFKAIDTESGHVIETVELYSDERITTSAVCMNPYDSTYWLGSGYLLHYNPKEDTFSEVYRHSIFGNSIMAIAQVDETKLLVGAKHDLKLIELKEKGVEIIDKIDVNTNCLLYYNNKMLLGNTHEGLFEVQIISQKVSLKPYLNTSSGLPNNSIASLQIDDENNLWIGTYDGLVRYNEVENKLFELTTKDGLTHNEFNHNSSFNDNNGKLYFGGLNGINVFESKKVNQVIQAFHEQNILVSKVSYYNSAEYGKNTVYRPEKIVLKHSDNDINIQFAFNDLFNADAQSISYRLVGFNDSWKTMAVNEQINYSSLPSGDYMLEVKGKGRNLFTSNVIKIPVMVTLPFYRHWLFYSVLILITNLLGFGIYRFRTNQIKKVLKVRTQIAKDLHDELGSELTKISMQSELIKHGAVPNNDEEIGKISKNSRTALKAMKDVVWNVSESNNTWESLHYHMRDHIHEMFSGQPIEYIFNADIDVPDAKIKGLYKRNLYLIFKESITNIVKHGQEVSTVQVDLKVKEPYFELCIADNGKVDGNLTRVNGNGMKNMKARALAIGANFHVEVANGVRIAIQKGRLK